MSAFGKLDPVVEHRIQFAVKGKREHIAKVNMPNIAYPSQHIGIEIPHGSKDHVLYQIPSKLGLININRQGT